jgi:hypothetical protein
MSEFTYLIAEGVTDVVFLQTVLQRYFGLEQVRKKADLESRASQRWLESFKWPHGDDIARHAVPAPVFMQGQDLLVVLRNAQGLTRLNEILEVDNAAFDQLDWKPRALGIFLDADDKAPEDRFTKYQNELETGSSFPCLTQLSAAEEVFPDDDGRRSGIFVFPGGGQTGTLDSLLLALGKQAFPELYEASGDYVAGWKERNQGNDTLFQELRKPAGDRKAQLSAMAAMLKPGKNLSASLQDHPWAPKDDPPDVLRSLTNFLGKLIGRDAS